MAEDYENEDDKPEDEKDFDVYKKDYRDSLVDDDELDPVEDGFMEGYEREDESKEEND